MELRTIINTLTDLFIEFGCSWRVLLCFLIGGALGVYVSEHVSADPLRWILAGLIILVGLTVGARWEASRP